MWENLRHFCCPVTEHNTCCALAGGVGAQQQLWAENCQCHRMHHTESSLHVRKAKVKETKGPV